MPLTMSPGALARKLNVPRTRIERIARQEIGITPDTALRLGRFFNTTPQFWMNFQLAYELETLANSLAKEIADIEPIEAQAAAA